MAGPYYVDISAPGAWVGKTGLDKTTNALLGLSGLQYLLDTIAVGSGPIYVKGSASDGTKMASLACDNLSGVFQRGEQVSWNAGANVGVVSELTANYPSVIEITTGAITDLVNDDALVGATSSATADVNGNSTQKTTIIDIDTNNGSVAAGFIKVIGCKDDADYTVTYLATDRAYIDVKGAVAHGIAFVGSDYYWLENIEVDQAGTAKDGINIDSAGLNARGNVLVNCCAHDCAGSGIIAGQYVTAIACVGYSNAIGIVLGSYASAIFSCARDNSNLGFDFAHYVRGAFGCISHNNTNDGFALQSDTLLMNCVSDGNQNRGISSNPFINNIALVIGCRITNQSQAGSDSGLDANNEIMAMGWNYFEDNGDAAADNVINDTYVMLIPDLTTSYVPGVGSPTDTNLYSLALDEGTSDEGYVDKTNHNFSTDYQATHATQLPRRRAITIPWT